MTLADGNNLPPSLTLIGDRTTNEGVQLQFTVTATDSGSPPQTLAFSLDPGAPSGASIDPTTGIFSWTPTEAQGPSTYETTVRVTDNGWPSLSDTETFWIAVFETNASPSANAGGPYNGNLGEGFLLDGSGSSDPDTASGDVIVSYQWDIAGGTCVLFGETPSLAAAQVAALGVGSHNVVLTVEDTFGLTNSDTTTLAVYENRPVADLTAIPNPAACDQAISFDASGSSHDRPDRNIVLYEWDFDGDGTYDSSSGSATTTHGYPTFGSYTVGLRVTDNNTPGKTDTATLVVDVNQGNRVPLADAGAAYLIGTGEDLLLDGGGSSDPDAVHGDSIGRYEWDIDGDGLFEYDTSSSTLTVPWANLAGLPRPGVANTISLRVTDSFGLTDSDTSTLTIYEDRPVADLAANPNPAECDQDISFDASGSSHDRPDRSIVQYEWDFDGDGTYDFSSGSATTTHFYTQFGSYTVTLRVTDDNTPAKTDTATLVIDINQGNRAPVADAGGLYDTNLGEGVTLDGGGSSDPDAGYGDSIVSYSWDIASGTYTLGGATPWLTAAQVDALGSGDCDVVLTVEDTFGLTASDTTTLTIHDNQPIAALAANPNPAACDQDISFDASGSSHDRPDRSIVQYEWDFDDGTSYAETAASAPDGLFDGQTTHAYGRFGSYTTTLTVTDDNAPAKTDTDTLIVDVNQGNRAPAADAGGLYDTNLGEGVTLDGGGSSDPDAGYGDSIVSYSWDIASGTYTLGGATPWLTAAQVDAIGPGSHNIVLMVTDTFGLTNDDTTTLTIYENQPIAALAANPNPAACNEAISFDASGSHHDRPDRNISLYEWDFDGDGTYDFSSGSATATHAYPLFGSYTVSLRVTDDNLPAKTDTETLVIDVNQGNRAPLSDAGGPYLVDIGQGLSLDGGGSSEPDAAFGDSIVSYSWDIASGTYTLGGATPWLTAAQVAALGPGSHAVALTVQDTLGLTGVDMATLEVRELDFGDAPDASYSTLLAGNGARHVVVPNFHLGVLIDGEIDGLPNATATGDDAANLADEDGVVLSRMLLTGNVATFDVTVTDPSGIGGFLDAWIDTDRDGNFETPAGEHFIKSQAVANGLNRFNLTLAAGVQPGQTYARFRLSSAGGLTPQGPADDGEVEDYQFEIVASGEISGSKWNDLDGNGQWDAGEPGLRNWMIFLDLNQNGQLDGREPSTVTDGDGAYSFQGLAPGSYVVAESAQIDWVQTFAPQVVDLAAGEVERNVNIGNVYRGPVQTIDDDDPGFETIGSWEYYQDPIGYEGDLHASQSGNGADLARWTFAVEPGTYQVAATWYGHSNRAPNAPYTIYDDGTLLTTVPMNQQLAPDDFSDAGGMWEVIDTVTIAGDTLVVELSDDADSSWVNADAVRIERALPGLEIEVVGVLDGDTTPSAAEGTDFGTAVQGQPGPRQTYTVRNVGTVTLTLGSVNVPTGYTLTEGLSGSLAAGESDTFTVRLDTAVLGTKSGQIRFSNNNADENPFNFTITGTVVEEDAVTIIVDDADPGFETIGSWEYYQDPIGYEGDLHASQSGNGADMASWTFTVTPGTYQVAATWYDHANRAINAPYTIYDGQTALTTVPMNQQLHPDDFADQGGMWEIIDTVTVAGNTLVVELSDNADSSWVVADAVRIQSAVVQNMPPAAPSNLAAVAASASQIDLSWSDNSNDEQGFKIERKAGANGSWAHIATMGAGVTTYQNTGLSPGTTYYYRVRAYNLVGDSSYSNTDFALMPLGSMARIVDDNDPGFSETGSWEYYQDPIGYEGDLHASQSGNGADVASWTFTVTPGTYQVAATWYDHANRAINAPYTIYDGQTALTTVPMNQQLAPDDFADQGGMWEIIDTVTVAGNTLLVELSGNADSSWVVADAVRIESVGPPPPAVVITESGGSTDVSEGGATDSHEVVLATQPTADVVISVTPDNQVALISPSAPLTFTMNNWDTPQTVTIGAVDDSLAEGSPHTGTVAHTVSSADGEYDGIAVSDLAVNITDNEASLVQILDDDQDSDPGFETIGSWEYYQDPIGYEGDLHASQSGNGADVASWTFTVTPGTYQVAATWYDHANRAIDAPYTIYDGQTALTTVPMNQQLHPDDFSDQGGMWEIIDTVTVAGNTLVVVLSDNADSSWVVADAVRIEGQVALRVETSGIPNDSAELLVERQLEPIVQQSFDRLAASLGTEPVTALESTTVVIADLPGDMLGRVSGDIIQIDVNAAGYGWFVDSSPADDNEFVRSTDSSELTAPAGSAASGRVDLLTTVMHELGHLLGQEHSDSLGLMDPLLPLGTRRSLDEAANEHGLETRALDEIFASLGAREE